MPDRSPAAPTSAAPAPDLRVDPQAVSRLRSALDDALARLATPVRGLEADARLPRPWLGDPVSAAGAAAYARHSTDGPDPALGAIAAYRAELERVRDGLGETDRSYTAAEDTVAASWDTAR
ncbi:hypothetical protein EV383_5182 [Pseudonocardia sediminis]|uniref:Excreted virulence factor EspC (Type VII ESX diderm) n=1 Tax=Pseudonocardia sediminis TaxID=1397368 RepID=A0A4Q7V636_PSEST|nr:hypothetical protein [Pseudonocardia sediminis]RZT88243.1 hypothetical protein EV383_5182 [Pseudonocardia sediminis]